MSACEQKKSDDRKTPATTKDVQAAVAGSIGCDCSAAEKTIAYCFVRVMLPLTATVQLTEAYVPDI